LGDAAAFAGVLDGGEEGGAVGAERGAGGFGAAGDAGEHADVAAVGAVDGDGVEAVVEAEGVGLPVGGDPHVAVVVEDEVVG
jgi:hypothetical protein